ncbi:F-box/WD repeat-containing protein 9-like isoform X2 [Temnothorax nylanderi]|uniref:F-box/WD repeat-containing protein 9-like isoform X2 n=1 Tax=Temnothorax nylanderi TaxID=102681 RepID=UPI003A8780A4
MNQRRSTLSFVLSPSLPKRLFVYGSTLVHGLSLVCTRFYLILKDANLLWKARINHMWPDASWLLRPAKPDKLSWMLSYVAIKQQTALWKQQESRKKRLFIKKIPGRSIGSVLLMHINRISHVVYTTNQHLYYKELPSRKKLSHEIENSARIKHAHDTCIEEMTAIDNTIYGCDFNNAVKSWVLTNTGLVHQRIYDLQRSDRLDSALWCISSCPKSNLFAIGSSCGTVYVFDSRSRNNPIKHYRPYPRDVIRLAMNTEYILSANEDKTVSVWDQRAGRVMKSITIPGEALCECINMRGDWVFIGDRDAKLHILNLNNDFELVKSYSTEHTESITRVHLTHECLITSSMDGTVRISSLTDPPQPIATLSSEMKYIIDSDYLNDIVAVTGVGIEVWCPKFKRVQRNNNKRKISIRDL